ncbi:MAG: threonylcarbamoyl-AMP synthase [Saprospiraceae bacterium]|nr:threonylcarbamoyl-AMP synthase [Saprospiraceae bacterium]
MQLLKIHHQNPSPRKVGALVDLLNSGQLIGYPTDSLYAVGCDPNNKKAVLNLCKLKGIDPKKADLTFLCRDMAQAAFLIRQLDRSTFKLIRKNVPGPFTFILPASRETPNFFRNKKKTVGIRIPNHIFLRQLLDQFGSPILTTSLVKESEVYDLGLEDLIERYRHQIKSFVELDEKLGTPSAVVAFQDDEIMILREGPEPLIY